MSRPAMVPVEPGKWRLIEDWHYFGFVVPAGFVSDLDSVPRFPFIHSRFKGRTVVAAILHDHLYHEQVVSRRASDIMFLLAMEYEGVPSRYQMALYLAVRWFGWVAWLRNRRSR